MVTKIDHAAQPINPEIRKKQNPQNPKTPLYNRTITK
jgi:hypothetical protein